MTCVAELMSPVDHTVISTQPLATVAGLFRDSDAAVLVLHPRGLPVGLLTECDLAQAAAVHPGEWDQNPCVDACTTKFDFLRPEQTVEGVLWCYRTDSVRPLAVLNGWKPVGILYPDPVFLWCLDQPHLDFTRLTTATTTAAAATTLGSPDQRGGEPLASPGEAVPIQHAPPEVSRLGSAEAVQATTPGHALKPGDEQINLTRLGSSLGGNDA